MTYPTAQLNQRAMLAYVGVSVWSARKLDRKQTGKLTRDAGASSDAARVNKHLLASADDKLKNILRIGNSLRSYVEDHTLPWDDAGNRLLPNENVLTIIGQAQHLANEFTAAVDEFVAEYPVLRAQALKNLGDMAESTDYPEPDVVRSKFSMRLTFTPLPDGFGDVRTSMTQEQINALEQHFKSQSSAQLGTALHAAWTQLREQLGKYADRLQPRDDEPDKVRIFRDTMVENLRRTVSLLRSLNIYNDPDLGAIADEVARDIASIEPDALRVSTTAAAATKAKVDDVMRRLDALLAA